MLLILILVTYGGFLDKQRTITENDDANRPPTKRDRHEIAAFVFDRFQIR
jgi:hypothetical protein